jgi:hypothetical protein
MHPQRLVVPLFQRPYVWNEENQWEPLWDDIIRVAKRLLRGPQEKHQPHFLGAVVLQVQKRTGYMQERTIIDGQQRLTTLQLLLDALHTQLLAVNALAPAMRIEALIENAEAFRSEPQDQFKVWPTNRDRPAFYAVAGATPPINYDELGHRGHRIIEAHRFFSQRAREWLASNGGVNLAEFAKQLPRMTEFSTRRLHWEWFSCAERKLARRTPEEEWERPQRGWGQMDAHTSEL